MNAKQAYDSWKSTQKVSMQVYTDVEMFALGFNTAQTIINEMNTVILEMDKDAKKMKTEIKKLKAKE
jgi:formate dehydrogenase assembly factor FdhD